MNMRICNYEREATEEDLKEVAETNVSIRDLQVWVDPDDFQPYVIYNNIRYNIDEMQDK